MKIVNVILWVFIIIMIAPTIPVIHNPWYFLMTAAICGTGLSAAIWELF